MARPARRLPAAFAVSALAVVGLSAQPRGPAPDPLVQEGAAVKLAEQTYVIPDRRVSLVPNVGIVVGDRATLVIDPGLGRRNGEAILREVAKLRPKTELFIASTHFHSEHTSGYIAFPPTAKYINSTVQEAEFAENGMQMVKREMVGGIGCSSTCNPRGRLWRLPCQLIASPPSSRSHRSHRFALPWRA
jgi:hypothetical protein